MLVHTISYNVNFLLKTTLCLCLGKAGFYPALRLVPSFIYVTNFPYEIRSRGQIDIRVLFDIAFAHDYGTPSQEPNHWFIIDSTLFPCSVFHVCSIFSTKRSKQFLSLQGQLILQSQDNCKLIFCYCWE